MGEQKTSPEKGQAGGVLNLGRLQAVQNELSHDTIECLEHLLIEAKQGRVIGLAFVAIKPRREGFTHLCGAASRDRVVTRGLVSDLDDDLRKEH